MSSNSKIKELPELQELLEGFRLHGKKIVHCHGVFDLLHIGHIRHLHQAKKYGDILVVTITPDRYVNKGPMRPVFKEVLRAEAVAAVKDVDYVAINPWSMAVETIQSLKPDFYVKGAEYEQAEKDLTGGIQLEEDAVKSVGGQLVYTHDITFSSSALINRFLPVYPDEVKDYLASFSSRFSLSDVLAYLDRGRSLRVLLVGEAIIDEYQYCEAIGKSQKEPMLAVRHLSTERFAGGILAAANHVAGFCEKVGLVTFVGAENPQEEFIVNSLKKNIQSVFLRRKDSPTIVKRRFIENYFFTKMMEVYEMNDGVLEKADNDRLCATLSKMLPEYDVVLVIDYGHGMFTREAIETLCEKARFLALNAQSNAGNIGYHMISRYFRADFACMAETELRLEARDRRGDLQRMVQDVSQKLSCDRIVVTRGNRGCLCFQKGEGFFEVPALTGHVIDRMGAGDAFLSVTALCVFLGAPMEVVGFIGNAVGAQAVATVGNRNAIERVALLKHIETLLK